MDELLRDVLMQEYVLTMKVRMGVSVFAMDESHARGIALKEFARRKGAFLSFEVETCAPAER